MKLEISEIVVSADRQRKEIGNFENLKESMRKYGLIHPIVVDENKVLISGLRRLASAKALGWITIECKTKADLNEFEREELELEENIARLDLSWKEKVLAKERLHELKLKIYGQSGPGRSADPDGWNIKKTAAALGESIGTVSEDIQLAKLIKAVPSIGELPSKQLAKTRGKKIIEMLILKEIAKRSSSDATTSSVQLLNERCEDFLPTVADESVDLIVTDPPFGIDIDLMDWARSNVGETGKSVTYEDGTSKREMFGVWAGPVVVPAVEFAIPHFARILKPGAHLYLFCAADSFHPYAEMLTKVGMCVRPKPLVWVKDHAAPTSYEWKYASRYECIIFAHKGKAGRVLAKPASDVLEYATPHQRIHPVERPTDLIKFLIEQSSSEGDLVLDVFAGSCVVARAAMLLKRRVICVESDEDMLEKAKALIALEAGDAGKGDRE
jgi:ParB family chromosome partitioning protein